MALIEMTVEFYFLHAILRTMGAKCTSPAQNYRIPPKAPAANCHQLNNDHLDGRIVPSWVRDDCTSPSDWLCLSADPNDPKGRRLSVDGHEVIGSRLLRQDSQWSKWNK